MPTDKTNEVKPGGDWNFLSGNTIRRILDKIKSQSIKAGKNITVKQTEQGTFINYLRGACCKVGICSIMGKDSCGDTGGIYKGDDSACIPNPCTPTGACCYGDGTCDDLTESDCTDAEGDWQGEDTTCDDTPCIGACCHGGTCSENMTKLDCENSGGTFGDYGSTCSPNPCPPPSCCGFTDCMGVPDSEGHLYSTQVITDYQHEECCSSGECSEAHYEAVTTSSYNDGDCNLSIECSGVIYRHPAGVGGDCDCVINSDCSTTCNPPGCSPGFIGCCNGTYLFDSYNNGTSCGSSANMSCDSSPGLCHDGFSCSAIVNSDEVISGDADCGTCCYLYNPYAGCLMTNQENCELGGGVWGGSGSICHDDTCVIGACCSCFGCEYPTTSEMCDIAADGRGGSFYPGDICEDVCPAGRCCEYTEFGNACAITTETQCQNSCCDPPCAGPLIFTEGILDCGGDNNCPPL